jgi:hypothetical protein
MELSYIQSLLTFTSIDLCFYFWRVTFFVYLCKLEWVNTLNAELNPICHMLTLLGAHHILHVSKIRVKLIRTSNAFRNNLFPFIPLLWQVHQICFFSVSFLCVFFRSLLLDTVLYVYFPCCLVTWPHGCCAQHLNNEKLYWSTTTAAEVTCNTFITTKLVTIRRRYSLLQGIHFVGYHIWFVLILSLLYVCFCLFLSCEFYSLFCLSFVSACW